MAKTETIRTAVINATSDGDNTVVAAVTGKRIRVLGYVLNVNAAGTVQWKSGAGTALSGAMEFVDGGGASAPMIQPSPNAGADDTAYWLQTAVGQALVIANPAGVDALGHLTYQEIS